MKPFKSPLIRKPDGLATTSAWNPTRPRPSQLNPNSHVHRATKRRKLSPEPVVVSDSEYEDDAGAGEKVDFVPESPPQKRVVASEVKSNATVPLPPSPPRLVKSLPTRKPLVPVKCVQTEKVAEVDGKVAGDGGGNEAFYNVLWRKPSGKKHKTWDGDGILAVRDGYAYLQDISGREMGRVSFNSPLLPGSTLSIAGKEVEVDSLISKKEYLAGKQFLNNKKEVIVVAEPKKATAPKKAPAQTIVKAGSSSFENAVLNFKPTPKTKAEIKQAEDDEKKKQLNVAAPSSRASKTAFRNPLKSTTIMPQKAGPDPVPRHDPNTPGAIVMKRPAKAPKDRQIVDVVVDPILGKHLRDHQREGVKFLYECVMGLRSYSGRGAILADDMGLGKTLQTITLLWTLLKQNPIYEAPPVVKKALIVCPATLLTNWRKEFRKWLGNERIGVLVYESRKTRISDFTKGKSYSIMIIGYEMFRTVADQLTKGHGVDIIIADEGHKLKTVTNKAAVAIQSLGTEKRVILSGTPIQNDMSEFFVAVDLVNPGLLGNYKTFMKEFEGPITRGRQPGALEKDIEKGQARNEELGELTAQFMLRRTIDILSKYLPPKTEYILFCDPTPAQANIYRQILQSPLFQTALGNSESALQLITLLKKVCNSPSLLKAAQDENAGSFASQILDSIPVNLSRHLSPAASSKLRVLDEFLHRLHTTTDEKIVLVSNYTSTLDVLANLLSSLSMPFLRLDGSTPVAKRQALVDDFNRVPVSSCFAFLLSAKAGGMGLNLIGASRLLLFDVDWNPATDLQAMARIHRDGQKRHCKIYRTLLKGSIEEKIWQRQVTKTGLADSVMDVKGKSGGIAQFSQKELRDLFRLDLEQECGTHRSLNCECGGKGRVVDDVSVSAEIGEVEDKEAAGDLPDMETLLTKASSVDMEEQERQVADGTHPLLANRSLQSKAAQQAQPLMQYDHLDASHFSAVSQLDEEAVAAAAMLDSALGDDVLLSVMRDEGGSAGISYVFKRTSEGRLPG